MKNIFKLGSVFMAIALVVSTLLFTGVFASADEVVASWEGNPGYVYLWQGKLTVEVYGYTAQTGDTWGEFASTVDELTADQYVEVTLAGPITGAATGTGSFTSRTWNETGAATSADSISDTGATFIVNGPLTSKLQDPNLGFSFGSDVTNQPDAGDITVTVTVYQKGGSSETTATAAATEVETTATAAATEAEPTATVTEAEPTATEAEPTATGAEPTATEPVAAKDWQLIYDGSFSGDVDFGSTGLAAIPSDDWNNAMAAEIATYGVSEQYKIESDAEFICEKGPYACWGIYEPVSEAQWWGDAFDAAVYPYIIDIATVEVDTGAIDGSFVFGLVGEGACTVSADTFKVYAYREAGTEPTTTGTEAEPTATEAEPTATEPVVTEPSETEPSATEPSETEPVVEPTATEAEKVYHAIDSWSDTSGVGYTWINPNNASGQIQVYAHIAGTNGKWEEFAGKWSTIADNQYVEIVYTGTFTGATKDAVSADSRVWNETTKSNDFIVSASDDEIVVRFYGPLTSKMMDPNLGLFFAENSLAAMSAMEDTHVTVTVYEEGEEPTQPTTESTEPSVDPTGTEPSESTPSQSETTPSESKTEPSQPSVIVGDANGDGAVNMKDVLLARKYLAGIEVTIDLTAADVNGDGAVNMKDILEMRKFLANIIDHFGA